ncbi:FAD/NAD(P)-binding domain-containing protein [Aspergillus ellipticus CBS 707.79]|uniref:FAD/NAD(P)-binding domain-containing protein n=1 Tax=Aspergillus ellipticus CBS 707.79 TaxID=1448320 RepID=A0A319DQC9_9EURO|nr:FAD/NAD(P)-binding domain-containing protein [Aspergillus ellipticus CBS 707.79]
MSGDYHLYDLVVVGAGWFGIVAAKSYIETHPEDEVLVLEAEDTCGGTWCEDRLYPGLKSNNMVGSYEYPDYPMDKTTYGVKENNHIPAATLHKYLTDYARHFGVLSRTKFNTSVSSIEPIAEKGWRIITSSSGEEGCFQTKKIIMATGLTSEPNMLHFKGQDDFNAPLFHAKDFCRQASATKSAKNAVVVGGAKSAFDIAYAFVQQGAQVDLVIRPDGNGPTASPRFRTFLHQTAIGRWLFHNFWHALGSDVIEQNGYDSHPDTRRLKPWSSPFWVASGLSIHNYQTNFFDLVKRGAIRVRVANIARLSEKQVHLQSGPSLPADVLICATGWKKTSSVRFLNCDLAIPGSQSDQQALYQQADDKILHDFPALVSQPTLRYEPKACDPLRLYRFMVPVAAYQHRNIAFARAVSTVSTSTCASIQGLWISAFFDGLLKRTATSPADAAKEAVLHSQWGVWRYPCGYSRSLPDMAFDVLPYFDLLVRDLGLNHHRKSGPWAEIMEPYKPRDYARLLEEWRGLASWSGK